MQEKSVLDASTLIALERAGLHEFLKELNLDMIIPPAVKEELGEGWDDIIEAKALKGKTKKKADKITSNANLERGEAECIALAQKEKLNYIIADDRKLIRQKYFAKDQYVREMKVIGFSFLLHLMKEQDLIEDVWEHFRDIIQKCGWERSEVYTANYTFLKEMGY